MTVSLRFAIFLLSTAAVLAAEAGAVLHNLRDLNAAVSRGESGAAYDLEAVVTLSSQFYGSSMTLQDADAASTVWVHVQSSLEGLRAGDRVHVAGNIQHNDHRPGEFAIACTSLTVRAKGCLPTAIPITPDAILTNDFGHRLVSMCGVVTDAGPDEIDANWSHIVLDVDGKAGYLFCNTSIPAASLAELIGARISIVGVCQTNRNRLTRPHSLYFDGLTSIRMLSPAGELFSAQDLESPNLSVFNQASTPTRLSAVGRVLAVWDRSKILLRTDSGLLVKGELAENPSPACGARIRLVGTPETDLYNAILARSSWRPESGPNPPDDPPVRVTPGDFQREQNGSLRYNFALHGKPVRLTGLVCGLPQPGKDSRLHLECDGYVLAVDLSSLPETAHAVDLGSRIEICGICVMETEKMGISRMFPHIVGYRIVPRGSEDLRVLAPPPWWTPLRLFSVICALFLILAAFVIWTQVLRRAVERRSRALVAERIAHVESTLKVQERTRLSVELHDTLSQNLVGAAMEINTAEQIVSDGDALRHLTIASKTLKSSRDELRNCIWDLRSQALEESDMNAAIRKTLEPYVSDIDLQVRFNVPREILTDNTAHALMRIIRELVLNAIRHGRARHIKIAGSREDGSLLFSVRDDGCGFDPDRCPGIAQGHFGLQGVKERLRMLRGSLSVESTAGKGSHVSARFRLPEDEREKI